PTNNRRDGARRLVRYLPRPCSWRRNAAKPLGLRVCGRLPAGDGTAACERHCAWARGGPARRTRRLAHCAKRGCRDRDRGCRAARELGARHIPPTDQWSAKQYTAFEAERTRPVRDLVAAIPNRDVKTAIDLGCGPGNSTEVLAAAFPDATVTGL